MMAWQVSHAPTNAFRLSIFQFVHTPLFEGAIFAVIIANITLMACDYYRIEEDVGTYNLYTDLTNIFVHIYYVECVLMVIGMGKVRRG